jgi:hypothetical protein
VPLCVSKNLLQLPGFFLAVTNGCTGPNRCDRQEKEEP